jgi:ATP-dependent helicase/DNAse subunit B
VPLKLITGPVNSGKADLVLFEVGAAADAGLDPVLVAPTLADADLLRRDLARRGVTHAVRVTSFRGLWELIARRAGFDPRPLSAFVLQRIARVVVDETLASGQLALLEASAQSDGFAAALAGLADELGEVRATPARFAEAMNVWDASPDGRGGYGAELAILFRAYRERLEAIGGRDESSYVAELLDTLAQDPGRWRKTPVAFYGFDDFELRQVDTIRMLSEAADAPLTVSFPYEQRAAFEGRERIFGQLIELADGSVTNCEASKQHYFEPSADALYSLERALFELAPVEIDPGQAVERFEAGGERAEIELVAARAAALIGAGAPPEQIAVAVRDLDQSAPLIEEVFAAANVAIAIRKRVKIGHTALVRGILALLSCALCEDPQSVKSGALVVALIGWLRTPGASDANYSWQIDRLERERMRGGLTSLAEAELKWLEITGFDANYALESLRSAFAEGEQAGYRRAAELARRVLASSTGSGEGDAPILDREQQLNAEALGDLIVAFDELDWLVEKQSAFAPELHRMLKELSDRELSVGESLAAGAVSVALPLSLRARRVETLIVARMQEGLFPQRGAEDPFLDDAARRSINRAALDAGLSALWPSSPPDRIAAERHLLHALLSRATKLLIYSHHVRTDAGDAANASLFLDDIEDLFEPQPDLFKRALGQIDWPGDDRRLAPSDYQLALAALPSLRAPEQPYQLSSPEAIEALSARGVWSATSLERYLRCRMAWLVNNFLRPRDLEPDADQLAYGGAVHKLLQRLFERLHKDGTRLTDATLSDALELIDPILAGIEPFFADPLKEQIQRRGIKRAVAAYLSEAAVSGSAFTPGDFELSFGMLGEEPADLGDGLVLSGKIDRVDVHGDQAIIIDYKTGSVSKNWPAAKWISEGVIQNALYALVYGARNPKGDVVGALYQPVRVGKPDDARPRGALVREADEERSRIVRTDRIDEDQFAELLLEARALAVEAVEAIGRGELQPQDPKKCSYSRDGGCAFPGICRSKP